MALFVLQLSYMNYSNLHIHNARKDTNTHFCVSMHKITPIV